jgi:hypothetical protein
MTLRVRRDRPFVSEAAGSAAAGPLAQEFNSRIATGIEDATNRLVEAGRREQAHLFGRVKSSAPAKGFPFRQMPMNSRTGS